MKRFLSLFILLLSFTMARAQVNGCTDDGACNYDQAATLDDGSCVYPSMPYYPDFDGDGSGTNPFMGNGPTIYCSDPGYGWSLNNFDCNESNPFVFPGAVEVCNGIDDNCDGQIDEGFGAFTYYYTDNDGDGFGSFPEIGACSQPAGYVLVNGDCNDSDASVNPGAIEICNTIDDNCNTLIDDLNIAFQPSYFPQDSWNLYVWNSQDFSSNYVGFYNTTGTGVNTTDQWAQDASPSSALGWNGCTVDLDNHTYSIKRQGFPVYASGSSIILNNWDDEVEIFVNGTSVYTAGCCGNSTFVSAWSGALDATSTIEVRIKEFGGLSFVSFDVVQSVPGCTVSDACNYDTLATANDGSCIMPSLAYYEDYDGDGYGTYDSWMGPSLFCTPQGAPWSSTNDDCNDGNPTINPGASEVCNGIDDNCSGVAEEGLTFLEYFVDADADGYGIPASTYTISPITYSTLTPQAIPSAVTLDLAGRIMSYTGISINGATNAEVVTAGSTVSLTYNLNVSYGPNMYCPGCVTQSYIGLGGSTTTLQCEADIYNGYGTSYNSGTFVAPTTPGTYYIVQNGSLDYVCQPQTYANTAQNAIAILQVEGSLPALTTAGPNCNECTTQIPVGFSFPFYGNNYTNVAMSSEGFLSFDLATAAGCCSGGVVPSVDAINNAIYFGWHDLNAGSISYFNLYNPTRLVININASEPEMFDWWTGNTMPGGVLNAQVVLFENGNIEMHYNNLQSLVNPVTVGVENANGLAGVTLAGFNSQFNSMSNVAYQFAYTTSPTVAGISSCSAIAGYAPNNTDCVDTNPAVNPGATEICNTIDDNCDGEINEGLMVTYYADADGDGFGTTDSWSTASFCADPGLAWSLTNTDCNDSNAAINPAASEVCNGIDDNCSGVAEEGLTFLEYFADADADGYGIPASTYTISPITYSALSTTDTLSVIPSCDNCATQIPVGFSFPFYGNNYTDVAMSSEGFLSFNLATGNGCCSGGIVPSADAINNGIYVGWHDLQADTITYFNLTNPSRLVIDISASEPEMFDWWSNMSTPGGVLNAQVVLFENGNIEMHYNNLEALVNPVTVGVENANGLAGVTLAGFNSQFNSMSNVAYQFAYTTSPTVPGISSCSAIAGYAPNNTDCLDNNAYINPGATEVCNSIDDNCDTQIDEGLIFTNYYADVDGDGFGAGTAENACDQPVGYVTTNTDCNNNNAAINPGATELCTTSVDDNCNGLINEGCVTAGEDPSNATSMTPSIWPACSAVSGTLVGASASSTALTTCLTGEDKWHQFVATSEGVSIVVNSTSADIVIELQTAAGVLVAQENAVSGLGGEILNHTGLTAGQIYKVGVRNYNSAQGTGTYSVCAKMLKRGGCDYGPGPYTLCQYFKATWAGATGTSYTYTFTGVSGPADGNVYTRTQTSDICVLSSVSPTLPYGSTYNVLITNTFTINNAAGVAEIVSVPGLSPCTMSTAAQPVTVLRTADRCAAGPKFRGAIVAALPWVCGSTNWRWEFTELDASGNPVGLPIAVNRGAASNYINLGTVLQLQYGKTYNVRTAPILPYTGTNYQWGTTTCMSIVGTAGIIADGQDASESTSKVEITNDVNMSLYPNPSHGTDVNINLSGVTSDNVQIRVVDAMGRQVWSNRYSVDGILNTNITFEQPLANGLYFVEAIYNGELQTQRMMIQR